MVGAVVTTIFFAVVTIVGIVTDTTNYVEPVPGETDVIPPYLDWILTPICMVVVVVVGVSLAVLPAAVAGGRGNRMF